MEPNGNTAQQIESACKCPTGCNHWVDLSSLTSSSSSRSKSKSRSTKHLMVGVENAQMCVSPCEDVMFDQADAQCQVRCHNTLKRLILITAIMMGHLEIRKYLLSALTQLCPRWTGVCPLDNGVPMPGFLRSK